MSKKSITLILPAACLSLFPFSALADDGLSGLAGIIFGGFILLFLILVFGIWTLTDSFLSDKEKPSDDRLSVKLLNLLKLAVPISVIIVINAIMIQDCFDISCFINTLNGIIAFCLILGYVLSPAHKKLDRVITGSWLVVVLLIVYVFWEYNVLSWF